jgi:signal transduction histidine kinase
MAQSHSLPNVSPKVQPRIIAGAIVGISALLVFNFFTEQTFSTNPYLVIGSAVGLLLFAGLHLLPRVHPHVSRATSLYLYHWILCFVLIFIVPTLSYFLYIWVLLIYLTYFSYKAKGVVCSAIALWAALVMGVQYQDNGLTLASFNKIVPQYLLLLIVSITLTQLVFSNIQKRTDMESKADQAERERARLLGLINTMYDPVITTDGRGYILAYNAAALNLLDTHMTLTGKHIRNILKLKDSMGATVDIFKELEGTVNIQRRNDLILPVGAADHISLDISISTIKGTSLFSKKEGYTLLLRDITKEKSLDEEKDIFISEVSHELRTPITIAEGELSMGMLLADKPRPAIDDIKESVTKAHEQVVFLADMVNDLTALSRAERSDASMEIETFKVSEIIKEIEQLYTAQAAKKGLYFKTSLDPAIDTIATNKLYFKEIMQNFVTNAIKYTQQGGISVHISKNGSDHVTVAVTDTGNGIAKSEQAKVFDKFWRSEDPLTRSTSGTGLGLFITKKLAKHIRGELALESELKKGSTFSLTIPLTLETDDLK